MSDSPRLDLVYKAILAGILGNVQWKDMDDEDVPIVEIVSAHL